MQGLQVAAVAQSEAGAAMLQQAKLTWQSTAKPMHLQRESHYESQIANSLVGLGLFHVRVRPCLLKPPFSDRLKPYISN